MVGMERFSSNSRNKTRTPTITTIIQHSFGSPSQRNKAREVNKVIQIWKEEVKVSLFVNDMILYTENPKGPTKKILETINKYSKAVEYKTNVQKSIAFLNAKKFHKNKF